MSDLTRDELYLLWGALIKVLHEHNRITEESAQMFDWPQWTWELSDDEFGVMHRFLDVIAPQRTQ